MTSNGKIHMPDVGGGGRVWRAERFGQGDHRNSGTSSWPCQSSFTSDDQPSALPILHLMGVSGKEDIQGERFLPLHMRKDSGRQQWHRKRSLLKLKFNDKQGHQLTGLSERKLNLAFTNKPRRNTFHWVGSQTGFHVGSYLERFWWVKHLIVSNPSRVFSRYGVVEKQVIRVSVKSHTVCWRRGPPEVMWNHLVLGMFTKIKNFSVIMR